MTMPTELTSQTGSRTLMEPKALTSDPTPTGPIRTATAPTPTEFIGYQSTMIAPTTDTATPTTTPTRTTVPTRMTEC